jgi:hypothetical protein
MFGGTKRTAPHAGALIRLARFMFLGAVILASGLACLVFRVQVGGPSAPGWTAGATGPGLGEILLEHCLITRRPARLACRRVERDQVGRQLDTLVTRRSISSTTRDSR